MRVLRVSLSKPVGQTFCVILVRDILSSVDGDTRDAPREAILAKFASSDTYKDKALSIFMCRVL